MANELTAKQQAFAEAYVDNGGNQTKAAISAGYATKFAGTEGSRLIRNTAVQQQIMSLMHDAIGFSTVPALKQVVSLSRTANSEYVRLQASQDLLDRGGFKAVDTVDHRLDKGLSVVLDIAAPRATGTEEGGSKNGAVVTVTHQPMDNSSKKLDEEKVIDHNPIDEGVSGCE